jgi:hypothetical protein
MPLSRTQMDWAGFLREKGSGEGQIAAFGRSRADAIPIFSCRNDGGLFAATIGLMDVNQAKPGLAPVYTELLLSSRSQDEIACRVLSAVALCIREDGWRVGPGALLEGIVAMHVPDTRLPHLYFTFPDQYADFDAVSLTGRTIHPLVAFPVSEAEAKLVRAGNGEQLETFWENKFIDPVDWERDGAL